MLIRILRKRGQKTEQNKFSVPESGKIRSSQILKKKHRKSTLEDKTIYLFDKIRCKKTDLSGKGRPEAG